MNLFLSKLEVAELTGRKQRQKQLEQLTTMRITFTLDAFGWPKVLRRAIEIDLGANSSWQSRKSRSTLKDSELNLGDKSYG